ncbi:hypothetical protein G6F22_015874 [Rhizopus arrhizus]|nr:hypothetical protein G6F22_015874 [Rhizopus arrhizus]
MRYAFELANRRERKQRTVATKSNGIAISMPWWDERADAMGKHYPDVKTDKQHIDILAARFVLQPQRFDVVVASNLFGDILSDLGPACTGTIGIAPSANLNPERKFPSLFEPVHGSAPDIYGQGIANPIAMIWSGALMLQFLGSQDAHDAILAAIALPMYQDYVAKSQATAGLAEITPGKTQAEVLLNEGKSYADAAGIGLTAATERCAISGTGDAEDGTASIACCSRCLDLHH